MEANTKTAHGLAESNYEGVLLHLASADSAGFGNVCPWHRINKCSGPCVDHSGRTVVFPQIQLARFARTAMFFKQRARFFRMLEGELGALVRRAEKKAREPIARLDATSDLGLAEKLSRRDEYSSVMFFDYTKSIERVRRWLLESRRPNYHLTFSLGAGNFNEAYWALRHGVNVAVAFRVKPRAPLPARYMGREVIDGDISDYRFRDPSPRIVGLRAKGASIRSTTGFIVDV